MFGYSTFAGLGIMIFFIFFNFFASKYQKIIKSKEMIHKDQRLKLLNEVLNGIRVLKLYAWERSFMESIGKQRRKELQVLLKSTIFESVIGLIFSFLPFVASVTTFAVYVTLGNELTAEKAFTGLVLFNILRLPFRLAPMVLLGIMNANVAVKRISKIL